MQCGLSVDAEISLRLLEESDTGALHELIEVNRARLALWLPWAVGQTADDTLDFVRRTRAQLEANDGFQAAIALDGRIVGMAGFPGVDWDNRSTHIGYWLDEVHEGRGIATAAVRALVDHALTAWGLNRVEIRVAVENERSRAIPERLGFRREGTLRKSQLVAGRYLDVVVYATIAADAAARQLRNSGRKSSSLSKRCQT